MARVRATGTSRCSRDTGPKTPDGTLAARARRIDTSVARLARRHPKLFRTIEFAQLSPFGVSNMANTNVQAIDGRLLVGYDDGIIRVHLGHIVMADLMITTRAGERTHNEATVAPDHAGLVSLADQPGCMGTCEIEAATAAALALGRKARRATSSNCRVPMGRDIAGALAGFVHVPRTWVGTLRELSARRAAGTLPRSGPGAVRI